jgi:PEGA domain
VKRALALTAAASLLALASVAGADDATDKAKMLFNMGAQAYDSGQFPAAIQAFEEAYRVAPRPGIVFSMAQAYRRQYYLDKRPDTLKRAVRAYHDYLDKAEQGPRRAEAAESLAELDPIVARLAAAAPAEAAAPAPEAAPATRLMVSAQAKGAMISVDGGKAHEAPLFSEVTPGKHTLRLSAEGYFDASRDIDVPPGSVSALDIPLRERPALVVLRLPQGGAQISIDDRLTATTPLARPLEVTAGRHVVAVIKNGYQAWSAEITVDRGESKALDVKLHLSGQRILAMALAGVTVVGAAVGLGFSLDAAYQQREANKINVARFTNADLVTCQDDRDGCKVKDAYSGYRELRDRSRTIASAAIGVSLVAGAAGLLAYTLDVPALPTVTTRKERESTPTPTKETPTEIGAAPLIGPGLYGAMLSGRF